jgi:hypothetical protein
MTTSSPQTPKFKSKPNPSPKLTGKKKSVFKDRSLASEIFKNSKTSLEGLNELEFRSLDDFIKMLTKQSSARKILDLSDQLSLFFIELDVVGPVFGSAKFEPHSWDGNDVLDFKISNVTHTQTQVQYNTYRKI